VSAVQNQPVDVLGPAPVRTGPVGRPLSGQRATVLERLQHRGEPATVTGLAAELGLHANTVREHVDALVESGLVVRRRAPAHGRGRPAWQYSAALDLVEHDPRVRDYAGLAGALAGHLSRTSAAPAAEALDIGRDWGRELATTAPADDSVPRRGDRERRARHRTVDLLAGLGFAPEADDAATTAGLRRCPLLDVARAHPEVVCNVHLGIVRGALEVYGGDPEPTSLLPFAEPGACRLHLSGQARP
jgi:predicted ArsR family transcriptional regulator